MVDSHEQILKSFNINPGVLDLRSLPPTTKANEVGGRLHLSDLSKITTWYLLDTNDRSVYLGELFCVPHVSHFRCQSFCEHSTSDMEIYADHAENHEQSWGISEAGSAFQSPLQENAHSKR